MNLQNLKKLMIHYRPKTFGITTFDEYLSITTILHLEGMEVTELLNFRDFVDSFFSTEYGDELDMVNKDKLSAIKAVIGKEILKKGGTMEVARILICTFTSPPERELLSTDMFPFCQLLSPSSN